MTRPPDNIITIYGRKPVLEALNQPTIQFFRVHLADSNQASDIIKSIKQRCRQRDIDCRYHDRQSLSRISKNRKQDQGVAADIINPQAQLFADFLRAKIPANCAIIAIDNVTNPQNLGMIIRSVTAGGIDGLLLPRRGCARLDSLAIKASAGSVFNSNLLFCDDLLSALHAAKAKGFFVYGLSLSNSKAINELEFKHPHILILGNESEGISADVSALCDQLIHIPMSNGIESLNVSVTAGILSFRTLFLNN